jgi:putative peptide zinc metalloprotease protein
LRRDLRSIPVGGRLRPDRLVIDEISGCFARVSEHVWQALIRGRCDESWWSQARAAGWTRQRCGAARPRFSPLYVRIPFGSVDAIAAPLAAHSGLVFAPWAMAVWSAVIAVAGLLAIGRSGELLASVGSLPKFLEQSSPLGMALLLAATKILHELAHAVMCRRMGARCGSVGLLLMAGIPCPYCDVTDVWRQPSRVRRAAVMLAGIYVEWIIAAIATLVWVAATDPAIRLYALHVMLVCGISTLVFNANPLMRYDGYYVLGDLLGSANLRQEAGDAFRSVVTARIAGPRYAQPARGDARSISLAIFHAVSLPYRVLVAIAIAVLLLAVAESLHLRPLATGLVIAAIIASLVRMAQGIVGIARGGDRWHGVPPRRRVVLTASLGLVALAALWAPLPRYRSARGWVDAADATSVYVSSDAMVEQVWAEIGEPVQAGQPLVTLHSELLEIQQSRLQGQLRVAQLRSNLSRRGTLDHSAAADQWKTLRAAEEAVEAQLASVDRRVRQCELVSPRSGVVLPAESPRPVSSTSLTPASVSPALGRSDRGSLPALRQRAGTAADARSAWCRISPDGRLHAVLVIDARDRPHIDVGTPVKISLADSPLPVLTSTVTSVSAIDQDTTSVTRQSAYQVLCPLPPVEPQQLLRWIGKPCRGVFAMPPRRLANELASRAWGFQHQALR